MNDKEAKTIHDKFKKLASNNKDKDWNNPTFRDTMRFAFASLAANEIEAVEKKLKEKNRSS